MAMIDKVTRVIFSMGIARLLLAVRYFLTPQNSDSIIAKKNEIHILSRVVTETSNVICAHSVNSDQLGPG